MSSLSKLSNFITENLNNFLPSFFSNSKQESESELSGATRTLLTPPGHYDDLYNQKVFSNIHIFDGMKLDLINGLTENFSSVHGFILSQSNPAGTGYVFAPTLANKKQFLRCTLHSNGMGDFTFQRYFDNFAFLFTVPLGEKNDYRMELSHTGPNYNSEIKLHPLELHFFEKIHPNLSLGCSYVSSPPEGGNKNTLVTHYSKDKDEVIGSIGASSVDITHIYNITDDFRFANNLKVNFNTFQNKYTFAIQGNSFHHKMTSSIDTDGVVKANLDYSIFDNIQVGLSGVLNHPTNNYIFGINLRVIV